LSHTTNSLMALNASQQPQRYIFRGFTEAGTPSPCRTSPRSVALCTATHAVLQTSPSAAPEVESAIARSFKPMLFVTVQSRHGASAVRLDPRT
jgi:hypothetical protein